MSLLCSRLRFSVQTSEECWTWAGGDYFVACLFGFLTARLKGSEDGESCGLVGRDSCEFALGLRHVLCFEYVRQDMCFFEINSDADECELTFPLVNSILRVVFLD